MGFINWLRTVLAKQERPAAVETPEVDDLYIKIENPEDHLLRVMTENAGKYHIDKDGVITTNWDHPEVQRAVREQLEALKGVKTVAEVRKSQARKGQQSAYPVPSNGTPRGMTYRQHLVSQLAPVLAAQFLKNDSWSDYEDMADSLMMMVDSIIEEEGKTE